MTTVAEFTVLLTGALSAITSGIRNMSIKLSGGYTDNEYADALMREHRAALAKQGLTKSALIDLPHLSGLAQGGIVQPAKMLPDMTSMVIKDSGAPVRKENS
jgi:3-deoxy-D-arabino-heptulosonate 7-phosphate (DAHP) synthase